MSEHRLGSARRAAAAAGSGPVPGVDARRGAGLSSQLAHLKPKNWKVWARNQRKLASRNFRGFRLISPSCSAAWPLWVRDARKARCIGVDRQAVALATFDHEV